MSEETRRQGLGRGLSALLGDDTKDYASLDRVRSTKEVPIERLHPGKYQPRRRFDADEIAELVESVRTRGILQPILVRRLGDGPDETFEIVAGERRWRAAQLAGLEVVPVVVREVPDDAALAMSLIENIQRENLNPIEEAAGIQRLISEFSMTHEQAADAVGRSRSATTNLLRLLKLASPVQAMVMDGALEMGHARALLSLDPARQIEVANRVVAKGLSVRETERLVFDTHRDERAPKTRRVDRDLARLQEETSERLGTTVEIRPGSKGRGKLLLHYASLDHLDDLLIRLRGE